MAKIHRKNVRGFVSSADISTASAMTLTGADGETVALGADARLVVQSISATYDPGAATGILTVFEDTDDDNAVDAGEEIWAMTAEAAAVLNHGATFPGGWHCAWGGGVIHVLGTVAGTARVSLQGYVEVRTP